MLETFTSAFLATSGAVFQVLIVALGAAVLIKKDVLSDQQVNALSATLIRVLLPCMVFSNMVSNFNPGELKIWPLIPLGAVLMMVFGLILGVLFFIRDLPDKKIMIAPAALQNAGYLILPLGRLLYPEQFDLFAMYCFLFLLPVTPALWSLGKYLVSSNGDEKLSVRTLATPPFIASLLGLAVVLTNTRSMIPPIVLGPVELIGSATVPIAIFVLGAILARVSLDFKSHLCDALRVILIKLILTPIATIACLYFLGIAQSYPLLAKFFILQSAAAPATALIIQVRHYGGDEKKLSSVVLLCYLVCILTIPLWIAIWDIIVC